MERTLLIKENLKNGFNCAQVVAVAFAGRVNKEKETLLAAASGFGGGIGRQAKTCGAVSGVVIVLGFAKGQTKAMDSVAKESTYQSVRDFCTKFKEMHGAISCKELLDCDISTPEGFELHKKGCHIEKCFRYIETSIEILDDMLKSE